MSPRRRRSRGFSLVEILISLALGSLLVAGAFEIQRAFNQQSVRQQQIADQQQSLRVARQVMERVIRGAGTGMQGGALSVLCPGPRIYYPVQLSNSNALPATWPKNVGYDANPNDADGDPDWIQVVAASSQPGGTMDGAGKVDVVRGSTFAVNDLFFAVNTDRTTAVPRLDCVRQVTGIQMGPPGLAPSAATLLHGVNCYNLLNDPCLNAPGPNPPKFPLTPPAPVVRLPPNAVTIFRVETAANQTCCTRPPCLCTSFHAVGQVPNWQLLAEDIEDLQVALVMRDGRVCGTRDPVTLAYNSVDDPALCEPRQAEAVRFTLTARSSSPITGYTLGRVGGIEDQGDFLPPAGNDANGVPLTNYLRRSVTSQVELRNNL